ncbi:MAG: Gfo/Idh/MocA family oxidoreductase [Gemmataceae bacterium]|nr:Gfo/Idh/MocA family oxidoreductase [Gemmataceae bacterium]
MSASRRVFLQSTAAIAALAPAGCSALGANERLNIGLIGAGGRCRHLMRSLGQIENVRIGALCDVYEPNIDLARPLADKQAVTFANHRELLDRKDIDAVLIATPDHWHAPITLDAMAAGKHVYVEKPLTHKPNEARALREAQTRHRGIVVQVGTQQRSMPHIQRARELVREGRLGTTIKVHLTWNRNTDRVRRGPQNVDAQKLDWKRFLGNAPDQPFDDYKFRNWRWFWDFGNGILGDLMVHWIDVAHWILDLDHPLRAVTIGNHVTAQGVWQTPDTIQTLLQYPNNLQVHFEGTFGNARNASMIEFMGSEATLYVDRGRFELIPEARSKQKPEEMILGQGPRGRDFYERPDGERLHLENWLAAIRNNRTPNAPIEAGIRGAAAAHLGNEAFRQNKVADWKD